MAELIIGSVVDSISGQIISLVSKKIGLAWDVKKELEKLQLTVSAIGALLRVAEKRRVEAEDVKDWLEKLKDVVYEADDLLDDFATQVMRRRQGGTGNRILNEVSTFFSSSNQIVYAFKNAHRVKDIRERLEAIKNDKSEYKVEENTSCPLGSPLDNRVRPETYPFETEPYVVGRFEDKEEIINFLLNPDDFDEDVSILPIVGVGGLGKTTLTRLVFNDESVKECFGLKLWVCVSTSFVVEDILRKIVRECSPQKELGNLNMNELGKELRKELSDKRFLLVLDDVWNDNRREWLKLQGLLMNGVKGSKILVTTRESRVAKTMAKTYYRLSGLGEDDSVSLLMRMAMKEEEEWKNQNLETIAKKIVNKCVGVPLAITTIGRLLLFTGNTEEDWLDFQNNDLSRIDQKEGDIMPSLKLSYDFLPSHLKHCFAYCSLFPKDCELDPSELIYLWMAQGFVNPLENGKTLEEVGRDYFMELVSRSFFQEIEENIFGSIKKCKMHDLMHDLAQTVAGANCTTVDIPHVKEFPKGTRHLSFASMENFDIKGFEMNKRIRSLLLIGTPYTNKISHLDISHFGNLRALRLRYTSLEIISGSICKLKHLRSLDLSWNRELRFIPNSISRLCNLENLNLKGCYSLEKLPRDITKLVNLRQLDVRECIRLKYMPRGIGKLTSLQILCAFVVGEKQNSDAARLNELSALAGLRKKLQILRLERLGINYSSEFNASFSMEKLALQSLELQWDFDYEKHRANHEDVLERIKPHLGLKGFKIYGYLGGRLSSWFGQLHNLVSLKIKKCNQCKCLPPLDQFSSLKKITLIWMDNLEWIELSGSESKQSPFPSLKVLRLDNLPMFKGWRKTTENVNGAKEEENIHGEVKDDPLIVLTMFSDMIEVIIDNCPRFSCLQGQQSLHLGGTTKNVLRQLLRNSSQPTMAMPTQSIMTFNSMSFVSLCTSMLTSLSLEGLEDMEILPVELFQSLQSLRSLEINCCHRLKSLSVGAIFQHLRALESLRIKNCRVLDLSIEDDVDDEERQEEHFSGHKIKLRSLHFENIQTMETLPRWIQHLSNLEYLSIFDCWNMEALPEWFPQLTSLKRLIIDDDDGELSRRCETNTGEDWPKISHIKDVFIL